MGAQLEELILEGTYELELVEAYAENKAWLRAPDEAWKREVDADIDSDIKREDAANATA